MSAEPPAGPGGGEPRPGAGGEPGGPAAGEQERPGPDLARQALRAARAGGGSPGRRRPGDRSRRGAGAGLVGGAAADPAADLDAERRGGYSTPGPDPRDPQVAGTLVERLVADRGWQDTAAAATVVARWAELVGPEVAGHCRPTALSGGELTLVAESTAWATQLRLLAGQLLARIAAEVGPGVVATIRVHGPTAPSWAKGPRRIRGRGPRDTYG